jgi:hypothetical protein
MQSRGTRDKLLPNKQKKVNRYAYRACLNTINLLREAPLPLPVPDFSTRLLVQVLPSYIRGLSCCGISFGGCDLQVELISLYSGTPSRQQQVAVSNTGDCVLCGPGIKAL